MQFIHRFFITIKTFVVSSFFRLNDLISNCFLCFNLFGASMGFFGQSEIVPISAGNEIVAIFWVGPVKNAGTD